MNQINKILVIGATGLLAKPVVKELVNANFAVTAMVRNPEKAREELTTDVNLIKGDIFSKSDLEKAIAGQDAIYLNLSVKPEESKKALHTETDGLKNVIEVARKQGIQRIAMISSLVQNHQGQDGFDWWVFDVKRQSIRILQNGEIPYTIFYPSSFMENFMDNYRQGNKLLLAGKSLHKMWFIAGHDYGRQVAKSFQILKNENKEFSVQGLEGFTAEEACLVYQKNYTKTKLSISKAPLGLLKFLGIFIKKLKYGAKILEALNHYPEVFESEHTWDELGKPTITLAAFAKNAD